MYTRRKDGKQDIIQGGESEYYRNNLKKLDQFYRAENDGRQLQVRAILMLSSPITVMGVIEVVPGVATSAIGTTSLAGRGIAAGADAAAQVFFGKKPSELNVASIAGSALFGHPLASSVFNNIVEVQAGNPTAVVFNDPSQPEVQSRIFLGATLGVLANTFSSALSQTVSPLGGQLGNELFSTTLFNIV